MQFINDIPLKTKLAIMVLIPTVALLYLAQSEIRRTSVLKSQGENIIALSQVAVSASAMVHELQKERGMSAGYIGSRGAQFSSQLVGQRKVTDERISDFKEVIGSFDHQRFGSAFASALGDGMSDLDRISDMRASITTFSVPLGEALGFYTGANAKFLGLAAYLPKLSDVGTANNEGTAYIAFMQSKERAGIERAVLATTFATDRFADGMFQRLLQLVTTQDVYMNVFESLARPEQLAFVAESMQGPAIAETQRLRKIAIENAASGDFGVDSTHWFKVQTDKINILKKIEDQLSVDLQNHAAAIRDDAASAASLALAIALISTGLCVAVGGVLVRSIMRQLGADPTRLGEVVSAISNNNLDIDVSSEKEPLGIFADMCVMRNNLRERIEADHAMLVKTGRVQQALDNANSAVMIAATNGKIIYANEAASQLMQARQTNFRRVKPEFDAKKLVGTDIEAFHQDAQQMRRILATSTSTNQLEAQIGGCTLLTIINPIVAADGERLGIVLEFTDRTEEVATEEKVQSVVNSALSGDLSQRIDTQGMSGFFESLSLAVNQLVGVAERVIEDTLRMFSAMADGNLTESINSDYAGSFNQLKQDANTTVNKLTEIVSQISRTAESVKNRGR